MHLSTRHIDKAVRAEKTIPNIEPGRCGHLATDDNLESVLEYDAALKLEKRFALSIEQIEEMSLGADDAVPGVVVPQSYRGRPSNSGVPDESFVLRIR